MASSDDTKTPLNRVYIKIYPQRAGFYQRPAFTSLVYPELLQPQPEELEDNNFSCAELATCNAQSLFVNQQVAAEKADYLVRLTYSGTLRRVGTYFDLANGCSRSLFLTPEQVAKSIGNSREFFR